MPTLGKFIRRRRIELGLTQEALAELIGGGVRQAEISRLEHDRVTLPRRQRLEQIASALDVPIGELLVRSGWTGADDIDEMNGNQQGEIDDLRARNEELENRAERLESTVSVLATSNVNLRSQIADAESQTGTQVVQQFVQPLLDAVVDPVVIIGEDGEILSENAAFIELRNSTDGLSGITTADGFAIPEALGSFRPGNVPVDRTQTVMVTNRENSRSWHEVHVRPLTLEDGTRVSVVTVKTCDDPEG